MTRAASPPAPAPPARQGRVFLFAICALLGALVWGVFGQTRTFDFVNYDDPANVSENEDVARGLSPGNVAWAFTHSQVGHWDPLTTLSHMAVCHFAGLAPGPHHLVNVLLHALASILLFLVLARLTAAPCPSAFVAALFAIHPLRVESVAWITERKDVLSGVFFMLLLGAYHRYTRQPGSTARYATVILLFALGLMAKSMLVTAPCILLLLDYWPLRRGLSAWLLLREKIPLFALSALACLVQLIANQDGLVSIEKISLGARVGNALVAYATYLGQMFWPARLSVFYPHPGQTLAQSQILLALSLLLTLSLTAFLLRKKRPYLLVGWLWYLGMLLPVIGLIQSGELAHADRYTYLPQIGLALALTWGLADLCRSLPGQRFVLGTTATAGIAVIAVLALTAHRQTTHWRDNTTLWTHALACDPANYLACEHLAHEHDAQGRRPAAIALREKALSLNPRYQLAHNNLGLNYLDTGRLAEARTHFEHALALDPRYAKAHNNLGTLALQTGPPEEAIAHFKRALELQPDFAVALANLGNAYFRTGRLASAIVQYEKTLEITPDYVKPRANLASALLQTGRTREAIAQYEKVLLLQPDHDLAAINLASILATHPEAALRDGPRALRLAQAATQSPRDQNPTFLRTLAAAYAESGRFPEALATARRALALAPPAQQPAIQREIDRYAEQKPLSQAAE